MSDIEAVIVAYITLFGLLKPAGLKAKTAILGSSANSLRVTFPLRAASTSASLVLTLEILSSDGAKRLNGREV